MTKDNKTINPPTKSPATSTKDVAAPRKKLTLQSHINFILRIYMEASVRRF